MIDARTGDIIFDDGGLVGPLLTRSASVENAMFVIPQVSGGASLWSSFELAPRSMDGLAFLFGARLYFEAEKLALVDLWQIDPSESSSWDDWSMEGEIARQVRNEAWLASFLGPPHECYPLSEVEPHRYARGNLYRFGWGTITSSFSPQSACAGLIVSYDRAL